MPPGGVEQPHISQDPPEWALHRDTIVKLYLEQNRPLTEVQKSMEKTHGFKATKRMYLKKLKRWGAYKNMKAADKESLALQIAQAVSQGESLSDITFQNRPVNMTKILRYLSDTGRGRSVMRTQRTRHRRVQHSPPKQIEEKIAESWEIVSFSAAASEFIEAPDISPSPNPSQSSVTPLISTDDMLADCPLRPSYDVSMILSLPLSMPLNRETINMGLLIQQINVLASIRPPGVFSPTRQIDPDEVFWPPVKMATYLLKTRTSSDLAWSLLRKAGRAIRPIVYNIQFSFLRYLFTILSPGNMILHPDVRVALLNYLVELSDEAFGKNHPLAIVCKQLSLDDGACEASQRSLRFVLSHARGLPNVPACEIFNIQRSLISLYRRDRELDEAEHLAIALEQTSERDFGPKSEEKFAALMELVYVLTYQGHYQRGLNVCSKALRLRMDHLGEDYPDDNAIYAMENMAELYEYLGSQDECLLWLRQAIGHAWKKWGGAASTTHIRHKLAAVLDKMGNFAEAATLRDLYPTTAEDRV
ncbi:hypothetical protein DV736_g6594, partial [Chaetothyriales sp. CBS 134916]